MEPIGLALTDVGFIVMLTGVKDIDRFKLPIFRHVANLFFWEEIKGFIATKVPKVPQGSAMQICSENPDIGIRAAGVSVLGFEMKNIQ